MDMTKEEYVEDVTRLKEIAQTLEKNNNRLEKENF